MGNNIPAFQLNAGALQPSGKIGIYPGRTRQTAVLPAENKFMLPVFFPKFLDGFLQDRIKGRSPLLFPFRGSQNFAHPVKVLPGPANYGFGGVPVEILRFEGKNLRTPEAG
jgi:hypothetical protein